MSDTDIVLINSLGQKISLTSKILDFLVGLCTSLKNNESHKLTSCFNFKEEMFGLDQSSPRKLK